LTKTVISGPNRGIGEKEKVEERKENMDERMIKSE
jgi:hypothetical protein